MLISESWTRDLRGEMTASQRLDRPAKFRLLAGKPPQLLYPDPMLCSITELLNNGVRLKSTELPERVFGSLTIADSDNRGRRLLMADLRTVKAGYAPSLALLAPLFHPVITQMNDEGFALQGMQLQSPGGVVTEFVQVWWVRDVGATG